MVQIVPMDIGCLAEYTKLYCAVFNQAPWNDCWTLETAGIRLKSMMSTENFIGKALYRDHELKGLIFGQKEQFCDGLHFQIQEFCVKSENQKEGYGTALLSNLREELKAQHIVNVYLITLRGERTEEYYKRRGFTSLESMVVMSESL